MKKPDPCDVLNRDLGRSGDPCAREAKSTSVVRAMTAITAGLTACASAAKLAKFEVRSVATARGGSFSADSGTWKKCGLAIKVPVAIPIPPKSSARRPLRRFANFDATIRSAMTLSTRSLGRPVARAAYRDRRDRPLHRYAV